MSLTDHDLSFLFHSGENDNLEAEIERLRSLIQQRDAWIEELIEDNKTMRAEVRAALTGEKE